MNLRIINQFILVLIHFYQLTLSYFFGGKCRFYPSCSHYALDAYKEHDFIHATRLVLLRLSKCHPFSKAYGYDPLPLIEDVISEGKKI